ncbi:MAG: restriction endonuclease subunit S, partial [Bacteroidales bacterium]
DVGLFHIRQGGKGSVRSSLSFERLQEIEIPLPPLPEQRRIVKKIKEIEKKAKQLNKQNNLSFIGVNSMIDSYVEKLILANTKWNRFPLKEKAKINPSKAEINGFDGKKEVSFLPMPAVDDKTGTIKAPLVKKYSEVKNGYTYFRDGDVIFAKITPCMENGKSAICANLINGIGFGSTEFHVIRPNIKEILPEWIHLIIRSKKFREEAEKNMPGTAGQKRVPKEFLEDYSFPVPEIAEQKKIIKHTEILINKQESLKFETNKRGIFISALMPSVMAKAFNGEL